MSAQVSADHRYLAYAVDFSGNESYAIYVKDIGEDTVVPISGVHDASGQLAWALDNQTLFFTTVVSSSFYVLALPWPTQRGWYILPRV